MHAGRGRQVPGDDEQWDDIMYDKRRHRDQLSGSNVVRGGEVHFIDWPVLVHDLRCQQLLGHGGHGGYELHGLSCEQRSVCRRDELLL